MICDKFNLEEKTLLENINLKDKKVLDVGCGNGRYAKILSPHANSYLGIDINKSDIAKAIKSNNFNNVKFKQLNVMNINELNEKFDIIILSLAFHEIDIKEQGIALKKMINILSDNGKIIILDPALDNCSFQTVWDIAYKEIDLFDHDKILKNSKGVLENAAKLNIIEIEKRIAVNIDFTFDSIYEITDMLIDSWNCDYLCWNIENKNRLKNLINDFVEKNNLFQNEKIELYDKLEMIVIIKGDK